VIIGNVVVLPLVMVTEVCALRKPLAVATAQHVLGWIVKVKVPSTLASTDAINISPASYKLTVTGLLAITCPVSEPLGKGVVEGIGDPLGWLGVSEAVGVGDSIGVDVKVRVDVNVGVAAKSGVGENTEVAVGATANHMYVKAI
jgi:hypothetical protein